MILIRTTVDFFLYSKWSGQTKSPVYTSIEFELLFTLWYYLQINTDKKKSKKQLHVYFRYLIHYSVYYLSFLQIFCTNTCIFKLGSKQLKFVLGQCRDKISAHCWGWKRLYRGRHGIFCATNTRLSNPRPLWSKLIASSYCCFHIYFNMSPWTAKQR